MRTGSPWKTLIFYKKHSPWILFLAIVTGLSTLTFIPYIPKNIKLTPSNTATFTIVSPRYIEFESTRDKEKTQELRKKRAALVEKVYTVDDTINKQIKTESIALFTEIRAYQHDNKLDDRSPLKKLSKTQRKRLATSDPKSLDVLENLTSEIIEKMLLHGIREVDKTHIRTRVDDELEALHLDAATEQLIADLVGMLVRQNLTHNVSLTKKAQEREMQNIKPIVTVIKEGDPIIYQGETVQDTHIEILRALNLHGQKTNFFTYIGIWLLTATLTWITYRFLKAFSPKSLQPKYLLFIILTGFGMIFIALVFNKAGLLPGIIKPTFLIPLPVAALLLSQMVSPNIGMMVCTQLSILIGVMYFGDLYMSVLLFCSSCISVFATYKRYGRAQLVLAGYMIGGTQILLTLTYGLLKNIGDPWWFVINAAVGLFAGILSSMSVMAVLPYLETVFKITTPQTLMELSNLNHPLLKKLMMTAPGTYQHSLMVANLAEAAAESIHADPVLCRVGAYYHDIGKMKRPQFFTENQFSGENPHLTLAPRMSKLLISAHVRDGIELATKYKLPKVIQDFIQEHHGTTLVSFFFEKAKQNNGIRDPETEREDFRYPGPKPHFKEAGILMLADSVEAAIRSLDKPSLNKIDSMIEKIFHDKIDDGQLDNCPLSLREIDTIKATFLRIFHGIYHTRLDYQEEVNAIIKQTKPKK